MTKASTVEAGAVLAGKYRVESVLGEGGMGSVYRATHMLVGEPVALKLLRPDLAAQPEASARFLREAKTAMRLKCENVARVLDVGTLDGGDPYIAIELLEGADLGKRLDEQGPFPTEEAVDLVLQACHALAAAHAAGVIHRDIKPANLFLTRDEAGRRVVKLLDFGISKLRDDAAPITKTAAVMGSVPYMSPEQLESSKRVDERADIYSLGVTLYELLTGWLPFEGETMPQVCASIIKGRAVDIRKRRESVSKELAAVVHRAFATEADDRPATVVSLAASLLPFASAAGRAYAQRIPRIGVDTPPSLPSLTIPRDARAASFEETVPASIALGPVAAAVSRGPASDRDTVAIAAPANASVSRGIWVGVVLAAALLTVTVFFFMQGGAGTGSSASAGARTETATGDPAESHGPAIDVSPSGTSTTAAGSPVVTASSTPSATASSQPSVTTRVALPPRPTMMPQATTPPPQPTAKPSAGVWGRN